MRNEFKYLSFDDSSCYGIYRIEEYVEYVKTEPKFLDLDIGDLLSIERYGGGEESFHDSSIKTLSFNIIESDSDPRFPLEIELSLLGPYEDRVFHLTYSGVDEYEVGKPDYYHDFAVHELIYENSRFEHLILFSNGKTIFVCAKNLRFEEELKGCAAEPGR